MFMKMASKTSQMPCFKQASHSQIEVSYASFLIKIIKKWYSFKFSFAEESEKHQISLNFTKMLIYSSIKRYLFWFYIVNQSQNTSGSLYFLLAWFYLTQYLKQNLFLTYVVFQTLKKSQQILQQNQLNILLDSQQKGFIIFKSLQAQQFIQLMMKIVRNRLKQACIICLSPKIYRVSQILIIIFYLMEGNSRYDKTIKKTRFQEQKCIKFDLENAKVNNNPFSHDSSKNPHYSPSRGRNNNLETMPLRKKCSNEKEICLSKQISKRAYSTIGGFTLKAALRQPANDNKAAQSYNQNLCQLIIQELAFKCKTKIAMLLKSIDISANQFSNFTCLSRIDDILDFLAEKVQNKLSFNQQSKAENTKSLNKERQIQSQYQHQIQLLKKKQTEKEGIQKSYKAKLKESQNQIRVLYDQINQKERQLSQKITEIYQLKTLAKESYNLIESYKAKLLSVDRQLSDKSQKQASEIKKITNNFKNIELQNHQLKQTNQELNQIINSQKKKESQILLRNEHLNQQLQRWKQRFEQHNFGQIQSTNQSKYPIKSKENVSPRQVNPLAGKLSTLTLQNEISRLNFKIKDLQKQNRHLARELTDHQNMKKRYEELQSCISSQPKQNEQTIQVSSSVNQKCKQVIGEQEVFELKYFYKKKIEDIIKQWRDKMVEMISKNEQEQTSLKKQISRLQKANEQLQKKMHQLANQKYLIANQLIQKDRQIYETSKTKKSTTNPYYSPSNGYTSKYDMMKKAIEEQTNHQQSVIQSNDQKSV